MGELILYDVLIVVITTSIIQSVFGVGVLLFGTPLLLMMNYSFVGALTILLPVSCAINIIQVIREYKTVNAEFINNVLILSIPFVIMCLLLAAKNNSFIIILVGIVMILISLSKISKNINRTMLLLFAYDKCFFIILGVVHGLTNLGGSLLTSKIFQLDFDKTVKRNTISAAYLMLAIFQIITLMIIGIKFSVINIFYVSIGILICIIAEQLIFRQMNNVTYDRVFAVFLFLSGVVLSVKGLV